MYRSRFVGNGPFTIHTQYTAPSGSGCFKAPGSEQQAPTGKKICGDLAVDDREILTPPSVCTSEGIGLFPCLRTNSCKSSNVAMRKFIFAFKFVHYAHFFYMCIFYNTHCQNIFPLQKWYNETYITWPIFITNQRCTTRVHPLTFIIHIVYQLLCQQLKNIFFEADYWYKLFL